MANEARPSLSTGQQPTLVITPEAQVLRMTNTELLEAFDPNEQDSLVAQRLKAKSSGNAFVVWDEDTGKHIVDASVVCLEELIAGYPERRSAVVAEKVCPVLSLNMRPNVWVDENPACKNRPLHSDGTSHAGIPWGALSMHIRQLVYVGINCCNPQEFSEHEQGVYLMVRALGDAEADQLFQRSALKLRALTAAGKEPKLRVQLGAK